MPGATTHDDSPHGQVGRGELVRWLERIERALENLTGQVVAKGVYEAQRIAMQEDILELRLEFREFKHRSDDEMKQLRKDAEEDYQRIVNRAWWLFGTCAALALALAGLWLKGK